MARFELTPPAQPKQECVHAKLSEEQKSEHWEYEIELQTRRRRKKRSLRARNCKYTVPLLNCQQIDDKEGGTSIYTDGSKSIAQWIMTSNLNQPELLLCDERSQRNAAATPPRPHT